ncbi:MAG: undecaprenyl-diphosphate phosphatase [Leptospirillia bacterium]
MSLLQAAVLALVQGITEFLPISSSAHLILLPWAVGWQDQGLTFDVIVHLGSLVAVCTYFRHDILEITRHWLGHLLHPGTPMTPPARTGWLLIAATLPVGMAGLIFMDLVETAGRSPRVIGLASIGFGLLLWAADRFGGKLRETDTVNWRDAAVVGLMQALALIPGTSRSGITMTAGLLCGLTRAAAARFAFLLAIPVIALSGGAKGWGLIRSGPDITVIEPLAVGFVLSAVSAYLCIKYLMRYLERHSMGVFVFYRVALGVLLLTLPA